MTGTDTVDAAISNAHALIEKWALEKDSWCYISPSGKYYVLMFEPDGEHPTMQYVGMTAPRAWANLVGRNSNQYRG